jgi:carbon-monoxide dehydrogenase medium subunit
MKAPDFAYTSPPTIEEVVSLLRQYGSAARLLAGGQSLLPLLNLRLVHASLLIDLQRIAELDTLSFDVAQNVLSIGAMVRQARVEREALVCRHVPLLVEAVSYVGHPSIRNLGTIGGSVAHADPAAQIPAALLALDASVVLLRSGARRVVPIREFFLGPLASCAGADEVVSEILIPCPEGDRVRGWAFVQLARTANSFPICGVAVELVLDGTNRIESARVGLAGVGPTPVRARSVEVALCGQDANAKVFEEVASLIGREIDPVSDLQASAEYRRRIAGVLVKRALGLALQRAIAARENGKREFP